jgi:SsrA-binding protein
MILIENKKARMKYAVQETYSAGLELSGSEVKALRAKSGSLDGSRVVVRGGEAYLLGMTIPPYQAKNTPKGYEADRTRRLLLKKSEVAELVDIEDKKGLTIVPLEVYNNRYIKVRIAVVKGKTKNDHREDIKKRESDIDIERAMKQKKK